MDGGELPKFLLDILSFGPKHTVRDQFNEVHFLADIDKLVNYARKRRVRSFVKLRRPQNGIQKNVRESQMNRGVKNVHDFLRAKDLMAVPFNQGCGFCVMKKSTYRGKLDVLDTDQLKKTVQPMKL